MHDDVLTEVFRAIGLRQCMASGIGRVCRRWNSLLRTHLDWHSVCSADGMGDISRPDGSAVDWFAHFLSYMRARFDQRRVMTAVLKRKNVFMTGAGGSGKTKMVHFLVDQLRDMGLTVSVVAPTGMAAILIGGTTIHSWSGLGLSKEPVDELVRKLRYRKDARKRWVETDVLVMDEVSMMPPDLIAKFDQVARSIRRGGQDKFFGGMLIIASGDFAQLPPVDKNGESTYRFLFQHPAWARGIDKTIVFRHVYRTTDVLFSEILGRVRTGDQTEEDIAILKLRLNKRLDHLTDLGILPTRMYSMRANVAAHNQEELDKLEAEPRTIEARVSAKRMVVGGAYTAQRTYAFRYTNAENKAVRDCPVPRKAVFKNGAQVMLVINLEIDAGLINGSRGVVTNSHHAEGIEVLFASGITRVIASHTWKNDDARGDRGESIQLCYKQIPLALAWAITVHKAQGATLDAVQVDLGDSIFAPGMAYVALSRVRDLMSLCILSINPLKMTADPLAKAFYDYVERHGTHKGFCESICQIIFPTGREIRSLVRALPALHKRRLEDRQRREADAEGAAAAGAFIERRRAEKRRHSEVVEVVELDDDAAPEEQPPHKK